MRESVKILEGKQGLKEWWLLTSCAVLHWDLGKLFRWGVAVWFEN